MSDKKITLDSYEKELEVALGKKSPVSMRGEKEFIEKSVKAASRHNKKSKTVSLRMSEFDLDGIKRQASNLGIPYQTYLNMIVHQCVTGQISFKPLG